MMNKIVRLKKSLEKKVKRGFKGYPLASIALYGPTNKLATKIALGITTHEYGEPTMMRWHSETDIRNNAQILKEIVDFIRDNEIRSVVMVDKIIGCPHEEGIDYPEETDCPVCPYWSNRDRWTDEIVH